MEPTHKALKADDLASRDLNLGLVMENEVTLLDRATKVFIKDLNSFPMGSFTLSGGSVELL